MNPKVRCDDCGCIALRMKANRALVELEGPMREGEKPPTIFADRGSAFALIDVEDVYEELPVCICGEASFRNDLEARQQVVKDQCRLWCSADLVQLLLVERECSSFIKWRQTMSPREHVEMNVLEMQRIREDERDRQSHRWRIIELLLIGFLAPAGSMLMQYWTTQMQIDSSVKQAVKDHHEEQQRAATAPPAIGGQQPQGIAIPSRNPSRPQSARP